MFTFRGGSGGNELLTQVEEIEVGSDCSGVFVMEDRESRVTMVWFASNDQPTDGGKGDGNEIL
jgi:hypothetical protein